MRLIDNILRKIKDMKTSKRNTPKECKKCKHAKIGCYYSDECPRK